MANTYISRTQANGTSAKKFTASIWFKRSPVTNVGNQPIWSSSSSTGDALDLLLAGNGEINFEDVNGNAPKFVTTRKLRDPSAWYHVVVAVDSTQATDTNRVKIYLNGVQETVFGTANYPTQNMDFAISTSADTMKFGSGGQSPSNYFNGVMSHVNFTDGYVYQASEFGETDSTTGEWKIKTSPSVTYGINGCFILKDGNSVTDQSGNTNNFTVAGGTLTKTEDCPSNVFATLNALDKVNVTLSNGNLNASCASSSGVRSTFGVTKGKYYIEAKYQSTTSMCGVTAMEQSVSTFNGTGALLFGASGSAPELFLNGTAPSTYSSAGAFSANDIMQIALDMDSNTVYFGKNGSWFGGTSWTESTPTTGHTLTSGYTYGVRGSTGSGTSVNIWNFGNGFFGTTAVASAQNPDDGIGIFEYDVPTGYRALCTKSINAEEYS